MSEKILPKCAAELKIYGDEPDLKEWEHQGFKLKIVRHVVTGHLCGYLDIPEGHAWYGKDFSRGVEGPEMHGGCTFAQEIPDLNIWRIGFDCAHYGDAMPGMLRHDFIRLAHGIYRNMEYVTKECESLAEKAKVADFIDEVDKNWPRGETND